MNIVARVGLLLRAPMTSIVKETGRAVTFSEEGFNGCEFVQICQSVSIKVT